MTAQKRLSLLLLPLFGVALLWYATAPYRVGVSPDTMAFLNVAHHLQAGEGFSAYYPLYSDRSQALAAWPPLFPFVIWSGMPFGIHPLDTAWVVNIALFGVNLWLIGWIVARACRSAMAGWMTQIFFILYPLWRGFFIWGLSEPLFLFFVNVAVLFLLKYFESGRDRDWRIAALAVGLCEITRYIGGVYLPAFALTIFFYRPGRWVERFQAAVRFFILGSVIPIVWAVRNYFRLAFLGTDSRSWADKVFGSLMHREGNINSIWYNARSAMDACAAWVGGLFGRNITEEMNLWTLAIPFILIAAVVGTGWFRRDKESKAQLAAVVLGLLACCYTVGLIGGLTFSLFAGGTPVRYLLPTTTHVAMMFFILFFAGVPKSGITFRRAIRFALCAGFVVWAGLAATDTVRWVKQVRSIGADEARGARWRNADSRNWFPTPELIQDFRRRKLYAEQSVGRSF